VEQYFAIRDSETKNYLYIRYGWISSKNIPMKSGIAEEEADVPALLEEFENARKREIKRIEAKRPWCPLACDRRIDQLKKIKFEIVKITVTPFQGN